MSKIFLHYFLISLFFSSTALGVEAYCYRDVTGTLKCESKLELIPESYKAKAFFRDVPAKNMQNHANRSTEFPPETNRSSVVPQNSYDNVLPEAPPSNSLPPALTNNSPSRINSPKDDSFIDNQPSSLQKKDPLINKNKDAKIQIFVAKWCAHCKALENFLLKEKIQFAKFDVEENEYGKEMYEREGGGIPITKIGSNTIVGFEENKFKALVESFKPY